MVLTTKQSEFNIANAAEILYDFERIHFDELKYFEVNGNNLWQVCKVPVYFSLISQLNNSGNDTNERKNRRIVTLLKKIISLLFPLRVFAGRHKVLFFSYSADKLSRDSSGTYFNSLLFPIIKTEVFSRKKILLIERPKNGELLVPSAVAPDVNEDLLLVYSRLFSDRLTNNELASAARLAWLLNKHFRKNNMSVRVESSHIINSCKRFKREKKFYSFLFSCIKPLKIIGSEKMGSGLLAAAIDRKIPFFELQHGAIDQYYPLYILDARFRHCPTPLVPNRLLVFGNMAKDIIIRKGFFRDEEVLPVGKFEMDQRRQEFANSGHITKKILFVTQPYMQFANRQLVEDVVRKEIPGVRFVLKVHPLQPSRDLELYQQLLKNAKHVDIAASSVNIYDLLKTCDIVVGFFSTVLDEAAALCKVCITVETPEMPEGVHSKTGIDVLRRVIRVASYSEVASLVERFYGDELFQRDWREHAKTMMNYVFEKGYLERIKCLNA